MVSGKDEGLLLVDSPNTTVIFVINACARPEASPFSLGRSQISVQGRSLHGMIEVFIFKEVCDDRDF